MDSVIGKLNQLAGTAYHPDTKIVLQGLVPRLVAGATEAECLAVIEDRWREWGNDPKMRQHFNPETLFRESNFERYLNAAGMNTAATNRNGNNAEPPKIIRTDEQAQSFVLQDGTRMAMSTYRRRYG